MGWPDFTIRKHGQIALFMSYNSVTYMEAFQLGNKEIPVLHYTYTVMFKANSVYTY